MSAVVTVSSASFMASIQASAVRAWARRSHVLIFDLHGSIGLSRANKATIAAVRPVPPAALRR
jgi:hypothetical protein